MPDLTLEETQWQAAYDKLLAHGFKLRNRYKPINNDTENALLPGNIIDAIVVPPELTLPPKVVLQFVNDKELEIIEHLRSTDTVEYVVPVLKSIPFDDDRTLLVMPFVARLADGLKFDTSLELIRVLLRLAEGLSAMHSHNVAHGAVYLASFVEDRTTLVPGGFDFVSSQWTPDLKTKIELARGGRSKVKPKCYFADFRHAQQTSDPRSFSADTESFKNILIAGLHEKYKNLPRGLVQLIKGPQTTAQSIVAALTTLLDGDDVQLKRRKPWLASLYPKWIAAIQ
ncbi:hypothetical protein MKEN_01305900 [Mycena kentingensis (nom. inval.)]|nr:hypothetical protein MKEN_01305900 [Mycena kentingensis (nom. inval.)]